MRSLNPPQGEEGAWCWASCLGEPLCPLSSCLPGREGWQRVVRARGQLQPWEPCLAGTVGEDLPEGTLLCQAEGHDAQHVPALAGRQAQQLLHQQALLVWGHKGLSGTWLAGTCRPHPEPSLGTAPSTAQRTLTCQRGPGGVGLQVILPQAGSRGTARLLQGWAAALAPQPGCAVVVLGDKGPTAAPCEREQGRGWVRQT